MFRQGWWAVHQNRRVRVESPNVPEFPWISDTPIWPKWGESADELWHHRVSWRGKYKIIQSERVSKLEKWEGLRAGNSTTEGFETVNGNQGHIWPLYPPSTIGNPRFMGGRKAGNSNVQEFFCTTLYTVLIIVTHPHFCFWAFFLLLSVLSIA